jgi:Protein of unknown function (DUF3562)
MLSKIRAMDYALTSAAGHIAEASSVDTEIESLVQETHAPRELVHNLYTTERAKLERTAKIKTYVPVLIRRRVKTMLQERRQA